MFDNIRGDKKNVLVNLWELYQKLIYSAQNNCGSLFDVLFQSWGVVPDYSGCQIEKSFKAYYDDGHIKVLPGKAIFKVNASVFGEYESKRTIPVAIEIDTETDFIIDALPRMSDGSVQGVLGIAFYSRLVEGELSGKEAYTDPVQQYDLIRRYEGTIKFYSIEEYSISEDGFVIDSEGRPIAFVLWEAGISSRFFDTPSEEYVSLVDRRKPLLLSSSLLGFDPCSIDLSALELLLNSMVEYACRLMTLEDRYLDLLARVREIESRLGISTYEMPSSTRCLIEDLMYPSSTSITRTRDAIELEWMNPHGYNYTHVAIFRAYRNCASLTPPSLNNYKLIAIVPAEEGKWKDRWPEVQVSGRLSGMTDPTKIAEHYYRIVPARGLMIGDLSEATPLSITPYPKPVTHYDIVSETATTVTISIEYMNDYIWREIRISDGITTRIYNRGDVLHFTFSKRACQLRFQVIAKDCSDAAIINTTNLAYPAVPTT